MSYSCGSAAIQKQASTIFRNSYMVRKPTPDLCHEILNPSSSIFHILYNSFRVSKATTASMSYSCESTAIQKQAKAQSSGIHRWWRKKKPTPDPCHEILHHISNFHTLYNSFRVSKATAATISYSCVSAAIQKQTSTIFGNSHIVGGGGELCQTMPWNPWSHFQLSHLSQFLKTCDLSSDYPAFSQSPFAFGLVSPNPRIRVPSSPYTTNRPLLLATTQQGAFCTWPISPFPFLLLLFQGRKSLSSERPTWSTLLQ
jgi:hypothetical protein